MLKILNYSKFKKRCVLFLVHISMRLFLFLIFSSLFFCLFLNLFFCLFYCLLFSLLLPFFSCSYFSISQVSKPRELPPELLSEPCVKVSLHTAPNYRATLVIPILQCTNISLFVFATLYNHFIAFPIVLILYFFLTHFTMHLLIYFNTLYISDL